MSGMTVCMISISRGFGRGGGGGHKLMCNDIILARAENLAEIWTKDLNTSQTLLPLSHLDWIVCRCPITRALHQLSLSFCLQFTFTGSYHFSENNLCDLMKTNFSMNTWSSLVLLNALFLPHSQSAMKFEEQTSCGNNSLVYFGSKFLFPSQIYIISICYSLSFMCKVEHTYRL